MKLGLITYDTAHLKTEQVLLNLIKKYEPKDMTLFALPYVPRKERKVFFNHRPNQSEATPTQILAEILGIEYQRVEKDVEIPEGFDYYLILGAGILSAEFIEKAKKVINCHPGVIPAARGLDAFKWSILEMKPLGVTLHYIDKEVDKGEVISIVPTPIFSTDTLEMLARRHYENEIYVLSNFEHYLERPKNPFEGIAEGEPHRRMPYELEREMVSKFDQYKEHFVVEQRRWLH